VGQTKTSTPIFSSLVLASEQMEGRVAMTTRRMMNNSL
jgi:hypothetical protein